MFKPLPDVVATEGCGSPADTEYEVNWEEIARWALEHGEDSGGRSMPQNSVAPNNVPAIDWCRIADSFMRDEAADSVGDVCDIEEVNASVREHDQPILLSELNCPSESVSRLADNECDEFPSPIEYRGRLRTPEPPHRQRQPENHYSWSDNSESNRSMRSSYFNNTSCYDRTPLSPMRDFSCMEELHDSTEDYQSDIMSYLEGRAERNRPNSIAEGYHFPGRAYGTADNDDCRMLTSTPKKKQRTTRAETFEMADGSKMFNITLEECLQFGRKLKHISDVRDANGCQIMHLDREIDEVNGARRRVDIARRWLDLDQDEDGGGAGCS